MNAAGGKNAFAVVILGAGASSRMGEPKLLLPWRGTTVIGYLISQWRELGAAQIAVVLRANDSALAAELDRLDFPKSDRIENSHPERGMFSSILCAANWSGWQRQISCWAVALGDQPHLRTETLRQLLEFSAQNREAICQPAFDGHTGHPVVLPRAAFAALKNTGAATLKDFLKQISGCSVQLPVDDAGLLLDMDTPEDYKQLKVSH
jgi:CTP:molybdopterin cytidylyltransferase MocA